MTARRITSEWTFSTEDNLTRDSRGDAQVLSMGRKKKKARGRVLRVANIYSGKVFGERVEELMDDHGLIVHNDATATRHPDHDEDEPSISIIDLTLHQEKKIPCARRPPWVSWPAWRRRGPRGRRGNVLGQSNLRAHTTHGGCHPRSGTPRCRYSKSAHLDGVWHPRSGRSQSQHVTSTHEWQISIVQ
jgi:hypothetical protein